MNPEALDHQIKPLPCKPYLHCWVLLPKQRSWVGTPHWLHIWNLLRPCGSPWLLTKRCGEFWEHRADLSVNRDRSSTSSRISKGRVHQKVTMKGAEYAISRFFHKKKKNVDSTTSLRIPMAFPSLFHSSIRRILFFMVSFPKVFMHSWQSLSCWLKHEL